MGPVTVYLELGSNLGDRESNLLRGVDLLRDKIHISVVSRIFATEPWGYTEQPEFLNCVCQGETMLTPQELLSLAKHVEGLLGRTSTFKNGPRTLDVDILFYGEKIVSEPSLEIPHPGLAQRGFVLVPLAEIAPGLVHPVLGARVSEMLRNLDDTAVATAVRPWLPDASGGRTTPA